jgi:hypothetical protein
MAFVSSSSSTSSTPAITTTHSFSIKLNPKNYLAWKTQFLPILNYQNLHGYIDGTLAPPPKTILSSGENPTSIPNPEFTQWFTKDQMLLSWLLSSLTEEVFPYVIGLDSSKDVWVALANAFGAISHNRQLQLHIELQELKKNDLSVSQYLQKAKMLADELSDAGRPISSPEFNAIIYRNIGAGYHSLLLPSISDQNLLPFMNYMGNLLLMKSFSKVFMNPLPIYPSNHLLHFSQLPPLPHSSRLLAEDILVLHTAEIQAEAEVVEARVKSVVTETTLLSHVVVVMIILQVPLLSLVHLFLQVVTVPFLMVVVVPLLRWPIILTHHQHHGTLTLRLISISLRIFNN